MFCNQCGKQLPDGTQFCNYCGNNLSQRNAAAGDSPAEPPQQSVQQPVQQPMQHPQQPYQQPQQPYQQPVEQPYQQPMGQQPYQQPMGQQPYQQPMDQQYQQPMQQGYGYGQPMPQGQPARQGGGLSAILKKKWVPVVAVVLVLALVVGFLHPFGIGKGKGGEGGGKKESKVEQTYEALCSLTSLGTQSYLYARLLTEQLIATDLATSDPDTVDKLFAECLDAWDATGTVTAQIGSLAEKLTAMSDLANLNGNKTDKAAISLFPLANAANENTQAKKMARTLSAEDSIERCSQLGTQLDADVRTAVANLHRMQQAYNGRNTSISDWNDAASTTAEGFNAVVFVSGEITEDADTIPTCEAHSVHSLSNSMKEGGLVLENTDIVVDVSQNGATIVMGQNNGVSMNLDDLQDNLPSGSSSVITICTYPENPNDLTITFHSDGLDSWLIVGRVGGFSISRGDKDDGNGVTEPGITGGSFEPGDRTEPEIHEEFEHVTHIVPPEDPRGTISDWLPPVGPGDIISETEHTISVTNDNNNNSNNNSSNNNNNPPPGPVDVGTMTERLTHEGASQGEITVSMLWGTHDDLDLHMNTPDGGHIYYSNKTAGGGTLDVDMNASSSNLSTSPVENIYFPSPADGHYKVYIRDYRDRTDGQSSHYLVRVLVNGQERLFEGDIDATGTEIVVFEFDYVGPQQPTVVPPPTETDMNGWLRDAGAGEGDITVSLAWNSWDDVDLHINTPGDHHIYYSNKSAGGGVLDVDANAGGQRILNPVENIYFAAPQNGHYKVWINEYADRTDGTTDYLVRVTVGGQSKTFSGTIDTTGTDIPIIEFDYGGAAQNDPSAFNGHRYVCYNDNGAMSWSQARAYCQGLGGHLATVESAEEEAFLESLSSGYNPWIGLYGSEAGWNWVTGEPIGYTNWPSNQPDNANGDEWFVHIWGGPWNDLNNKDDYYHFHSGFICEWDSLIDLNENALIQGLVNEGALSGEITISMMWDSADDLDLHVFTPSDYEIYWDNPSAEGGTLDVDANRSEDSISAAPVENVYFAEPVAGEYWVYIYDYEDRSDGPTNYLVRVQVGDKTETFQGTIEESDTAIEVTGFQYGS